MKILVTGEETRVAELRSRLSEVPDLEMDFTDGDEEEDFKDYDCIFDLNFDDDPANLPVYASLRDKPVFVNAVKLSLDEVIYAANARVKCMLFGMNALPTFIGQDKWEVSIYRKFQMPGLDSVMNKLNISYSPVEDRAGMVKPRVIFMLINEACFTLQEGTATIEHIDLAMKLGTNYPYGPFEWCDKIGVTSVFETLSAIYDDTRDERYKICPLLKTKYLRNETFYRQEKS